MTTRNRGKQSNDDKLFSSKYCAVIKEAADDLSFLLTRGYGPSISLEIVGNKYRLNKRQQLALSKISHSQEAIELRNSKELSKENLSDKCIEIDGFNILIIMESYLSGAFIFKGRDGLYRDISSVHGTYKRVSKTEEALLRIGNTLKEMKVRSVKWYLDQPISNSGSLKTKLLELSEFHGFNWEVELVFNPDKTLAKSNEVVISSDSWILNSAKQWFNLGGYLIDDNNENFNVLSI
ncbi:DUF434 domain-containing protein [Flammeovirga aprica]|uniref:DUF434 domain-containing protein n=1 Tax=Flammeovirga aprica JL-4 TaxID=694437 RepID=A0A7X9RYP3_9BACT|nr:DUF434 domain-containing protein [Flammeovirga aprica]NME71064.1 DUF434 domain-containing protein [Flammeovirga aprica JL-4]